MCTYDYDFNCVNYLDACNNCCNVACYTNTCSQSTNRISYKSNQSKTPALRYFTASEPTKINNSTNNKSPNKCTKEIKPNTQNHNNEYGLLNYREWWEHTEVELSVNGSKIIGVPIFIKGNTLRVVNKSSSYFIPLDNVDYIRTPDGLDSCCSPSVNTTNS